MRKLILAILLIAAASSFGVADPHKLGGTLTITPAVAIAPEPVTFTGTGFIPSRSVVITATGPITWQGSYPVDANGNFVLVFTDLYTYTPPGAYIVTAAQPSHVPATASLVVE